MRLIANFPTEAEARKFSLFLRHKKIDCHLEQSDDHFEVWAKNEDQIQQARDLLETYTSTDPKIKEEQEKELSEEEASQKDESPEGEVSQDEVHPDYESPEERSKEETERDDLGEGSFARVKLQNGKSSLKMAFRAPITRFFVLLCIVLYIVTVYQQSKSVEGKEKFFPVLTPLQISLIYDYPKALELAKEFNENYSLSKEDEVEGLPAEARTLLSEIEANPPWAGFYQFLVNWQNREYYLLASPFSSILKGEVWRVFTPTILHANLLHLLFNMLWLWMIGKMMEMNSRPFAYIGFILLAAAITNTLQYLMSGPFFMGFSGVIAAMAGYIWVRKKRAPWEPYLIDRGTLIFLWAFIFGMLALQIIVFFLQILHIVSFQLPIANTAHVSGALLGMLLARTNVFQKKR